MSKSNLELGDTRDNKRALTIALTVIHIFSFVGVITLLAASTEFSWTRGLVAVLAVVIWLLSFILLFVNAMSYFFARDAERQSRVAEDRGAENAAEKDSAAEKESAADEAPYDEDASAESSETPHPYEHTS